MWRSPIKVLFLNLCFLTILIGCQQQTYPTDNEQLSHEEQIVIRFSHVVGENTPKGMAAIKFAELIKERSNGHVEIQVFPNGVLYKDGEEMNALLRGDIQMIAPAISKITTFVPEWSVMDLPYAFKNAKEVHTYVESEVGQSLMKRLNKHNLISMGVWDSGFKQLSNSIRPIQNLTDLQGLRMRIMPSDILAEQFSIAGAYPRRIDFNTVFHQLQKGNVDGQENTLTNITSKNLHSLQDYLTISNHGYLGYLLLMNNEFWNSLPKNVQELLIDTLEEVQKWEWQQAENLSTERLQEMEACQCIQIHYLTEEEIEDWENAFKPVYDYYAENYGFKYIEALPKNQFH
ncbi:DctP family TRAP transporter solute-binding subunit [Lysinibacillus sp. OL1_EC]|uniref:DctP family TRAP transporter solute-binding subunit n=1 Tax=unclassified Lysinibacillus TaxID=2636778 RepID=UPI00103EB967|nr:MULTISPECIES: DctP family TRAP transporter solute-binding subunit [unclassified Lysinibacillus]MCM0625509.1 DctP family TRAP transporter solute-binding subunit [Lysinibacillus sp. OL1_EC]MCS5501087.1 DctP family TRAP transporter solute-binding subunit [Lysinibacillus sp. A4]TBV86964.1 DctP family TRAP transporter solute-binding subunit [Lysinibacillus sp. OL1]UKJ44492.1 DctP family TRAP transporter solute-binding subunit [Lysinibacillus sp. ACHW1.5]WGT40046.1 DctP family TRAP transporter so